MAKRIGIVDIDTSHPGTWIPIIRELGFAIAGFHDSGHILWRSGEQAVLTFGDHPWIQSHLTLIAECHLEHLRLEVPGIYRSMLEAILPYLAGEAPAPVRLQDLVQPELSVLAHRRSAAESGRWVERTEVAGIDEHIDGGAFERTYRNQHYPDFTHV